MKRGNPELQAHLTEALLQGFTTVHHEEEPAQAGEVRVLIREDIVQIEVPEAQGEELLARGLDGLQAQEEGRVLGVEVPVQEGEVLVREGDH